MRINKHVSPASALLVLELPKFLPMQSLLSFIVIIDKYIAITDKLGPALPNPSSDLRFGRKVRPASDQEARTKPRIHNSAVGRESRSEIRLCHNSCRGTYLHRSSPHK